MWIIKISQNMLSREKYFWLLHWSVNRSKLPFILLIIVVIINAQASDYLLRIQFFNHFPYKNTRRKISQSANPFKDEILMTCFARGKKFNRVGDRKGLRNFRSLFVMILLVLNSHLVQKYVQIFNFHLEKHNLIFICKPRNPNKYLQLSSSFQLDKVLNSAKSF